MKLVNIAKLYQTFSFNILPKPTKAWAICVVGQTGLESIQGIPHTMLISASELSTMWTGWGFNDSKAWLLFENKDDALFAKIHFGEDL